VAPSISPKGEEMEKNLASANTKLKAAHYQFLLLKEKGRDEVFLKLIFCIKTFTMTDITLKEAQQQVDQWIKTVGVRYFSELTNLGILMEEVGELSRLMVRTYGEQSFKETDKGKELGDEMADVLWVLICLANQTGVDLTEALQKNFEKKNLRDAQRHKDNPKLEG
jgi:NTP pyrophosphatase (non-canonical NTP hydrolase)